MYILSWSIGEDEPVKNGNEKSIYIWRKPRVFVFFKSGRVAFQGWMEISLFHEKLVSCVEEYLGKFRKWWVRRGRGVEIRTGNCGKRFEVLLEPWKICLIDGDCRAENEKRRPLERVYLFNYHNFAPNARCERVEENDHPHWKRAFFHFCLIERK